MEHSVISESVLRLRHYHQKYSTTSLWQSQADSLYDLAVKNKGSRSIIYYDKALLFYKLSIATHSYETAKGQSRDYQTHIDQLRIRLDNVERELNALREVRHP
jgi:hypothetical protein